MRSRTLPFLLAASVLFASCQTGGSQYTTIPQQNLNPLTASRYGDELADGLANLIINNDPLIQGQGMRDFLEREIEKAKRIGADARSKQEKGLQGNLIPMKQDVHGIALYLNDVLHLSTDFETTPGPDLHVYLTSAVDPRDGKFPDATAVDLGVIQSAYGAQSYTVPHQQNPFSLRTIVLWDNKLRLLFAFGQLAKR